MQTQCRCSHENAYISTLVNYLRRDLLSAEIDQGGVLLVQKDIAVRVKRMVACQKHDISDPINDRMVLWSNYADQLFMATGANDS